MIRKTYPTAEVWTEKELTQDEYDAIMDRFAQMNEKSLQTGACYCIGRQNGAPYCPCKMVSDDVRRVGDKWVVPERNFPVK